MEKKTAYYHSTRGGCACSPQEAVLQGIAADGGLFVWDDLDTCLFDLSKLMQQDYRALAQTIVKRLLWDFDADALARGIQNAYARFAAAEVTPLVMAGEQPVLELFHGPTCAFKDVALCLLPQLMTQALAKRKERVWIVTATSGDTGKAALEGFRDVANIGISVFYPQGKVSAIQRYQMTCQQGKNVSVCAVRGNFDDAQSTVKALFADEAMKQRLAAKHIVLSSANSINIGRLIPQIVYYFAAYRQLLTMERVRLGDEVDFSVPSGNFGNVLAGYYARLLGLPVRKLIVASNRNNVLEDFLRKGVYDRNRSFHKTISPSMDILISSNLERLLYYAGGKDRAKVRGWMRELAKRGRYQVDAGTLRNIQSVFVGASCSDAQTKAEIKRVYEQSGYLMDPHTAVASYAIRQCRAADDPTPCVLLSTASPYKFAGDVLQALQADASGLDDWQCMERLAALTHTDIPAPLRALRDQSERFLDVIDCAGMKDYVQTRAEEVLHD